MPFGEVLSVFTLGCFDPLQFHPMDLTLLCVSSLYVIQQLSPSLRTPLAGGVCICFCVSMCVDLTSSDLEVSALSAEPSPRPAKNPFS